MSPAVVRHRSRPWLKLAARLKKTHTNTWHLVVQDIVLFRSDGRGREDGGKNHPQAVSHS